MLNLLVVLLVAFAGSLLTFFCGFGLGTILLPVFLIFFDAPIAIAMTAIVHFLNNLFKLLLTKKHIDLSILKSFGIPSVLGAVVGSLLLTSFNLQDVGAQSALKRLIGLLLIVFAFIEWWTSFRKWQIDSRWYFAGGLVSGFFGGLSGHQGALRSAFLSKFNLDKNTWIATGVAIACCVDLTRLTVYSKQISTASTHIHYQSLGVALMGSIAGAILGNTLLKKMNIQILHTSVTIGLIIFGILLIFGVI